MATNKKQQQQQPQPQKSERCIGHPPNAMRTLGGPRVHTDGAGGRVGPVHRGAGAGSAVQEVVQAVVRHVLVEEQHGLAVSAPPQQPDDVAVPEVAQHLHLGERGGRR